MREKKTNRRISSILRDNLVHEMYREELEQLGEVGRYVSKESCTERLANGRG